MADPLFLLDSNICIYILEGIGPALRRHVEAQKAGTLVTSAICYAEVMRGIRTDDDIRTARAERLFGVVQTLPFDRDAALAFRALPFRRHRFDGLIAAHALALGLTLVTNNEADFADVPGLKVENWTLS